MREGVSYNHPTVDVCIEESRQYGGALQVDGFIIL